MNKLRASKRRNLLHVIGMTSIIYIMNYLAQHAFENKATAIIGTMMRKLYDVPGIEKYILQGIIIFVIGSALEVIHSIIFRVPPTLNDAIRYWIGGVIGFALYQVFPYSDWVFYPSLTLLMIAILIFVKPKLAER